MIENTTKGIWMSLNTSVAITTGEDAQDDGKVFGMRQFRDNNAENLTDDEYLETVICRYKYIFVPILIIC
jgi:hypothetical protein